MTDDFDLVSLGEIKPGDRIILDDGSEVEVKGLDMEGCTKDQWRLRLKGRPPIIVQGYWRKLTRRLKRGQDS